MEERYFRYYHRSRCHLSLVGDALEPRPVLGLQLGGVVELPEVGEVGGLHHRYMGKRPDPSGGCVFRQGQRGIATLRAPLTV